MGRRIHTDTIIMVPARESMISTIYAVVNINKYWIKFSLTNDVVGIAVAVAVGGVVIGGVGGSGGGSGGSGGGALATAVDVATGAAVAANDDDAVGAVVPPSLTKDEDAYIGPSVAFKGACIGAFTDGAGKSAAASALLPPCCCCCAMRRHRISRCRHRS